MFEIHFDRDSEAGGVSEGGLHPQEWKALKAAQLAAVTL
jgi:hypothetical protein